jgi:hypothetical protein
MLMASFHPSTVGVDRARAASRRSIDMIRRNHGCRSASPEGIGSFVDLLLVPAGICPRSRLAEFVQEDRQVDTVFLELDRPVAARHRRRVVRRISKDDEFVSGISSLRSCSQVRRKASSRSKVKRRDPPFKLLTQCAL